MNVAGTIPRPISQVPSCGVCFQRDGSQPFVHWPLSVTSVWELELRQDTAREAGVFPSS